MGNETWAILTRPLVDELRAARFQFSEPGLRTYPDGAALITAYSELGVEAEAFFRRREPGFWGTAGTRALSMFGCRHYHVHYPGWYATLLGQYSENGSFIIPTDVMEVTKYEYEVRRVEVMVSLFRKFAKGGVEEFAIVVRKWYEAIGSKGIFGEGGCRDLSATMRYTAKNALFDLDAGQSGEHTMNTLTLALLDWGMSCRQPISRVDFLPGAPPLGISLPNFAFDEVSRSPLTVPLV